MVRSRTHSRQYFQNSESESDEIENSSILEGEQATLFRSGTMRCAYLAQDRVDISETVKCLARVMSKPRTGHMISHQTDDFAPNYFARVWTNLRCATFCRDFRLNSTFLMKVGAGASDFCQHLTRGTSPQHKVALFLSACKKCLKTSDFAPHRQGVFAAPNWRVRSLD